MRRSTARGGFTLVELLVVIGIIALLISILLPSLNAARRQANAVKCATALREMGNAFRLYALDNKNYYPPSALIPRSGSTYEIDGITYPVTTGTRTYGAYWFNFLAKYVTKTTVGVGGGSAQNQSDARKTILWGCTAFEGHAPASGTDPVFDVNPVQTGYCMNGFPTFEAGYPAGTAYPPAAERSYNSDWIPNAHGGFVKATTWGRRGAERCLVADGKIWLGEAGYVSLTTGGQPRNDSNIPTQYGDLNQGVTSNETNISMWRHSRLPAKVGSFYNPNKSKVAYNILYADGHVNTETSGATAYRALRMKYPG